MGGVRRCEGAKEEQYGAPTQAPPPGPEPRVGDVEGELNIM